MKEWKWDGAGECIFWIGELLENFFKFSKVKGELIIGVMQGHNAIIPHQGC